MTGNTGRYALLALLGAAAAHAQDYPSKPVRLVFGYPPGGAADFTGRVLSQRLQSPQALGQPVVIESRPGAGSTIAIQRVATSPPDGYTLLLLSEGGLVQSARGAKLSYDLQKDLVPVATMAVGPQGLIVHPALPVKSVKDLIALARQHPGKLSYGSSGNGSAQHLAGELFNTMAGIKTTHVPYKGGSQSAVAISGGEIEMGFATIPSAIPFISSRRLRLLAISLSQRVSFLPDTPTVAEAGVPGYECSSWYGVLAPAGTPADIVNRLNAAITTIVKTSEVKEIFNKGGLEPYTTTPPEFSRFIAGQLEKAARLSKIAGVSAE